MEDKTVTVISPLDFVAGCIGGGAGVLSGHPLDTVKVRLQTEPKKYKNTLFTLRTIIREEKAIGLFKGMSSPLLGAGVINAVLFGVYGTSLRAMSSTPTHPHLSHIFWAGCISGFVNSFISCPMELVKIRLQNQVDKISYAGPLDCIKQIWKAEGMRGFYRGMGSTLWRETPSYGVYFASYEFMVRMAGADGPGISVVPLLMSGGIAGVLAWFVTYPFDRLKTLEQSSPTGSMPRPKSMMDGFRGIIKQEGVRGLFAGFAPTAIRGFVTNAAIFLAVEATVHFFGPDIQEDKNKEIKGVFESAGKA
ncbi:hypothetical protein SmJEL517_g00406 [Synchytrium microbalum]|uniref:Uncharacterized protein n=1 Tax=Synchytrium microbalum TaxID=1806994 RepID=A0A507CJP3_9FUNG|nr:uncharacterized protein SmJEL517_g00406 [Synchytrium microbalum]TPX37983.1 hypothetical protein SmJEL517_g00406 [Synchytrium microbalum]